MPRLSLGSRLAYAAPGFAFAIVGIPVYVHLPKFYGDVLGVDLAMVGLIILLSRVWDAVTDPAIGYVSDRSRTPWGRRRPFLFAAAMPLAVSAGLLMSPPPGLAGSALTWWLGALLFVLFLSWTAVQIPHAALGAELAPEHHERTGLFAMRDGLWILGTLVAATAPGIVRWALDLPASPTTERTVFRTLAWIYAPLLLLLPWVCALVVQEPKAAPVAADSPASATRDAWRNGPFRVLLVAYAVGALGAALPATLILFYVEHVLRAAPLADAFLGAYFLTGFLCLPLWTAVSRRVGKKRAWLAAMVISVGAFSGAALLGPGDVAAYAAIVVVSGIGFGAGLVLPASLVADVVDYDEFLHGGRREGLYYGLWSIVTKMSAAVGAGAALPILKWSGYVALGDQPPAVLTTLRVLYAAVPCLCYAAGFFVAARFPIDERLHRAIRHAADLRRRGLPAADPLLSPGDSQ